MGLKTFDKRIEDDRQFNVGDWLKFIEIDGDKKPTGNSCYAVVTFVMKGTKFNEPKEAVMSVEVRYTDFYVRSNTRQMTGTSFIEAGEICRLYMLDYPIWKAIKGELTSPCFYGKHFKTFGQLQPNSWEFLRCECNDVFFNSFNKEIMVLVKQLDDGKYEAMWAGEGVPKDKRTTAVGVSPKVAAHNLKAALTEKGLNTLGVNFDNLEIIRDTGNSSRMIF